MAAVVDRFSLSLDFSSEKLGPDILWYNPPQQYKLRCNGDTGLKVFSLRSSFHVACQILATGTRSASPRFPNTEEVGCL